MVVTLMRYVARNLRKMTGADRDGSVSPLPLEEAAFFQYLMRDDVCRCPFHLADQGSNSNSSRKLYEQMDVILNATKRDHFCTQFHTLRANRTIRDLL